MTNNSISSGKVPRSISLSCPASEPFFLRPPFASYGVSHSEELDARRLRFRWSGLDVSASGKACRQAVEDAQDQNPRSVSEFTKGNKDLPF